MNEKRAQKTQAAINKMVNQVLNSKWKVTTIFYRCAIIMYMSLKNIFIA